MSKEVRKDENNKEAKADEKLSKKSLNIDFSSINKDSVKSYLVKVFKTMQGYSVQIFAVFVLGICGFLIWQINSLSNIAASEEKVLEQQQLLPKPQIDEETVSKIEQLEDQNIAVQSLFKAARENPFSN